jgi:DNA-directed RNA polymerase alpha subunit
VNIADIELKQFDLSVRARNCLHNAEVKLVGELTALSASDILRWLNAGKKTLREIRELLGSIGLKLKGDPEPAGPINQKLLHQLAVPPPPPPSDKPKLINLNEAGRDVQRRLMATLSSFSMSARARNVIYREKLRCLAELVQLDFGELMAFESSGKKTATELANLVKAEGFELGSRHFARQFLSSKCEGGC